jgi:adenosylcobinamide-GDP ribazoletransferase
MQDDDRFRPEIHDVWVAFSLLTRIPVPVDHARAGKRLAASLWAWPLVGVVLGVAAGGVGLLCHRIGLPDALAAVAALAILLLFTGALHEDGLADCADGLGGGSSKERALEIMKDSRIGAFGAAALGLALFARGNGIAALPPETLFAAMIGIGALSRGAMAWAMVLPNARSDGLSAGAGRPPAVAVALCLFLTVVLLAFLLPYIAAPMLLGAGLLAAPLIWMALRRLEGQTGDVLGGVQQLAEIGALCGVLAALGVS